MANITETSNWETGVYQFETTDPIQGGANGIDNLPHKQLGNRTMWLKAQVDALNALKGKTIPEFSAVTAYQSGEIVSYGGNIYRANSALAAGIWNASNWTALIYSVDADKLNGQLPTYYLDLANATGTLAVARLSGTYAISVSGNAATASTLQTARTIALGGDLSGSASFNGSANITITATVADSSHLHDYSNLLNAPVKDSVLVATTAVLTATYANGTSGVGATLTNSGTLAALAIDGVTLAVNDRVLVKNQATAAQNGIYTVTNIGSASVAWVMTRATDADTNTEIAGCLVCVDKGTANGGNTYTTRFKSTDTVGTTNCTWVPLATTESSITGNAATATKLQTARTINGVSFDGSANITILDGTTQAKGDNSSRLATTAFVKASGLTFPAVQGVGVTSAYTVSAAQAGQWFELQTQGVVITLPLATPLPIGTTFTFRAATGVSGLLSASGTDKFIGGAAGTSSTKEMFPYQCVTVVSNGTDGWYVISDGFGGDAFVLNGNANGYQKLPTGLIIQWVSVGVTTSTASNQPIRVTWPISFPHAILAALTSVDMMGATNNYIPAIVNRGLNTCDVLYSITNGVASSLGQNVVVAIGY